MWKKQFHVVTACTKSIECDNGKLFLNFHFLGISIVILSDIVIGSWKYEYMFVHINGHYILRFKITVTLSITLSGLKFEIDKFVKQFWQVKKKKFSVHKMSSKIETKQSNIISLKGNLFSWHTFKLYLLMCKFAICQQTTIINT